jgi:hypothetical protein
MYGRGKPPHDRQQPLESTSVKLDDQRVVVLGD